HRAELHHIAVGLWLQSMMSLGRVAAVDVGVDELTCFLTTALTMMRESLQWDEQERVFGSIGVIQCLLLEGLSKSPQLNRDQQKLLEEINTAWEQTLGMKRPCKPDFLTVAGE